jgi:hypothetical protein
VEAAVAVGVGVGFIAGVDDGSGSGGGGGHAFPYVVGALGELVGAISTDVAGAADELAGDEEWEEGVS